MSQLAQPASYDAQPFTISLGQMGGESHTDDSGAVGGGVYASPHQVNVDVQETSFSSSQYSHTGELVRVDQ